MNTHILLKTIQGEQWLLHKDNIRSCVIVDTPDFVEEWGKPKVTLVTTLETDEKGKPIQILIGNDFSDISMELAGEKPKMNLKLKTVKQ